MNSTLPFPRGLLLALLLTGACTALPQEPEGVPPSPAAPGGNTDCIVFGAETLEGAPAFTKAVHSREMALELVRRPMGAPGTQQPTKTEALTRLSSFQVVCTSGTAGDEALRWQATFQESGGGNYTGNQYWPVEDPSYHFYASNAPVTFAREGSYIEADNGRDVVGAFLESPAYKSKNNLTFRHLFARLGRFTVTAEEGKSLSDVDIRLTPRTGGRYLLRQGTWSRVTAEDPVCISPEGEGTRENDLYLVPGTYTLTASWTVWKRGFPARKEGFSADITLPAGEVTDISTVLGGTVTFPQLTLECLESGTLWWKGYAARTIEYSRDEGDTWTSVTAGEGQGTPVAVNAGDILILRGFNDHVAYMPSFDIRFRCYLYGDITSLVNGTGRVQSLDTSLARLFQNCTGVENHPTKDLILECTSFTRNGCYYYMFAGCTGLTRVPELPALSLTPQCYSNMFNGCTRLELAQEELPALQLAEACYMGMFNDCSNLRRAPRLPATSLDFSCYEDMFADCTSLEEAPDLPARTLPYQCYTGMFDGCRSLRKIKCLATQSAYTTEETVHFWMRGVSSSGEFIRHPDSDWWPAGQSGIPEGWTVSTATE